MWNKYFDKYHIWVALVAVICSLIYLVWMVVNADAELEKWNKFACYDVGYEVGAQTTEEGDYYKLCRDSGNEMAYLDGLDDAIVADIMNDMEMDDELSGITR